MNARRVQTYLIAGLWGGLGLLLILLLINEKNWRPLKNKPEWQVHSNYNDEGAYRVADRNSGTHWTTYAPMTFGMYIQVELPAAQNLNGLVLHTKDDNAQPMEWLVKTSHDGATWQTVIASRSVRYRTMLGIFFPAAPARYVQIIQMAPRSTIYPWKIHELDLLQPILPWQFERATFLFVIAGWLLLMLCGWLFWPFRVVSRQTWVVFGSMLVIVLAGWGLRVVEMGTYEPSPQEFQHIERLDLGKYTEWEWLRGYWDYTKTGPAWLPLLLARFVYQLLPDPRLTLRLISMMFGVLSLIVAFFFVSALSGKRWEGLFAAAVLSASGYAVWLSRWSDLALPLFCCVLLYLLLTYRFLYQNGSYGWLIVMFLVFAIGISVDAVIGYLPVTIIGFWSISYFLTFIRSHGRSTPPKTGFLRLVAYIGSLLPFGIFGLVVGAKTKLDIFPSLTLFRTGIRECWQALAYSGLTGGAGWLLSGLALAGVVQMCIRRHHAERFAGLQGIVFALLVVGSSSLVRSVAHLLVTLLFFWLVIKGMMAVFSAHVKRAPLVQFAGAALVVGYVGVFAVNTTFWGAAWLPSASDLTIRYRQAQVMPPVMRQLLTPADSCAETMTLSEETAYYTYLLYGVTPEVLAFPKLQRLSRQGWFPAAILFSVSSPEMQQTEVQRFLSTYYARSAASPSLVVYTLRGDSPRRPQRYTYEDLFFTTGQHVEDPRSETGIVRFATPQNKPGLLVSWPPLRFCRAGQYLVRVALWADGRADDIVASMVLTDMRAVLLKRDLTGADFPASGRYQIFDLPLEIDFAANPALPMQQILCLVEFTGKAEVRLDYIEVRPAQE